MFTSMGFKIFLVMIYIIVITEQTSLKKSPLNRQIRSPKSKFRSPSFLTMDQTFYSKVVFNSHFGSTATASQNGSDDNIAKKTQEKSSVQKEEKTREITSTRRVPTATERRTKNFTLEFNHQSAKLQRDIYVLMDSTETYGDQRDNFLYSSAAFLKEIKESISSEYSIAYGTFSDKEWSSVTPGYNETKYPQGLQTYLLFGQMDKLIFEKLLEDSFYSRRSKGNDILTALHQIASCDDDILGWRNNSERRVMIYTNQLYSKVGDVKVDNPKVKEFDGKCHLDENGSFLASEYNQYDYPALEDVLDALRKKAIELVIILPGGTSPEVLEAYKNDFQNQTAVYVLPPAHKPPKSVRRLKFSFISEIIAAVEITILPENMRDLISYTVTCRSIVNHSNSTPAPDECERGGESEPNVSFLIEVSAPCPLPDDSVTVIANIKYNAEFEDEQNIDINSICERSAGSEFTGMCGATKCGPNQICVMQQVQCFAAPCPPIPTCSST